MPRRPDPAVTVDAVSMLGVATTTGPAGLGWDAGGPLSRGKPGWRERDSGWWRVFAGVLGWRCYLSVR